MSERQYPSYPYLNIARRFGVDYGQVLACVDYFEASVAQRPAVIPDGVIELGTATIDAIADAFKLEQQRRNDNRGPRGIVGAIGNGSETGRLK